MASLSDRVVMTAEAQQALQAELEHLEQVSRKEIAERIKTAREWGDLKENSEYHDAKNDQAHLETKILRIREQLLNAEVREVATTTDVVGFGNKVVVEDAKSGKELTYELVSPSEASPGDGRLSMDSPVGKALLGARVGQTVKLETPRGAEELKVIVYRLTKRTQAVDEHVGRFQRREVPAVVRRLPALDVRNASSATSRGTCTISFGKSRNVSGARDRSPPRSPRRAPSRRACARSRARTTCRSSR